jgi:hypothetical protein
MCYKELVETTALPSNQHVPKETEEKNATDTIASVPAGLATLISTPTGIIPSVLTTLTCYSTTTFVSDAATNAADAVANRSFWANSLASAFQTATASSEVAGGGIKAVTVMEFRVNDPLRSSSYDLTSSF